MFYIFPDNTIGKDLMKTFSKYTCLSIKTHQMAKSFVSAIHVLKKV